VEFFFRLDDKDGICDWPRGRPCGGEFLFRFFRLPVCLVVNFDRDFCLYLAVQFSCLCLAFDAVEQ